MKVCTLKENGGLGIINFLAQNDVLLTKWLWEVRAKPLGLWAGTLRKLYGISTVSQLTAYAEDSSFLKIMALLAPLFSCAVERTAGELVWRGGRVKPIPLHLSIQVNPSQRNNNFGLSIPLENSGPNAD